MTKAQMVQVINALPENATVEDAIERLVMLNGIREGLQQIRAGQGESHESVMRWLDEQIASGWQA